MADKVRASGGSDVTVGFLSGLVNVQVDLVPLKKSDQQVKTKMICDECDEPVGLKERYVCPNDADHGPWTRGSAARAVEIDKELKPVTDEQLAELREPELPKGEVQFQVFPADQVDPVTIIGGAAYRIRPRGTPAVLAALVDLVADESRAFLGEITIRSQQKMVRCIVRDGNLVLVELVRPGEFNEPEEYPTEYPAELLEALEGNVDKMTSDFDPEAFHSYHRERAATLEAQLRDPNAPKPEKKTPVAASDGTEGLIALLQGNLEKPKKKAGGKKKAA